MIEVEKIHDGFTKYHIPEAGAVLHYFKGPEGGFPHSHPWEWFKTMCVKGWYRARRFNYNDRGFMAWEYTVKPGMVIEYDYDMIHGIIETAPEGCWTWCEYGPTVREPRFYRFREGEPVRSEPAETRHLLED